MRYLLDTNILLRISIPTANQGNVLRAAVNQLQSDNQDLLVTVQNLAEFWNVATRPVANSGFGASPEEVHKYLQFIEQVFVLITETKGSYNHWRKLIVDYKVSGVQVHDARLVSVMLENNIDRILTLNDQDFQRYQKAGIEAIHPNSIVTK